MSVISISKKQEVLSTNHKSFTKVNADLKQLPDIICDYSWSPIIWAQGSRAACNYVTCEYLAIDFDEGKFTIEDAKTFLQDYKLAGIIGTTKSHQKVKTTNSGFVLPACDRFRLVIPFDSNIEDARTYTYNMRQALSHFPADQSCVDAARFFHPCSKIVYTSDQTGRYPVDRDVPDPRQRRQLQEGQLLPTDVINTLTKGIPAGSRNSTSFRIACAMFDAGHTPEEIFKTIHKATKNPLPEQELRRTIENAQKYRN